MIFIQFVDELSIFHGVNLFNFKIHYVIDIATVTKITERSKIDISIYC